jgi:hypothetical protein
MHLHATLTKLTLDRSTYCLVCSIPLSTLEKDEEEEGHVKMLEGSRDT